jgi:hypothetical protein
MESTGSSKDLLKRPLLSLRIEEMRVLGVSLAATSLFILIFSKLIIANEDILQQLNLAKKSAIKS